MQREHGVWAPLSAPRVYSALQRMLAGERVRQVYIAGHIRPAPNLDILDVGCGPGDIAPDMQGARYVGVDLSIDYVERAKAHYGHLGRFYASDVADLPNIIDDKFDVVVATGLLHHLDDDTVVKLLHDATRLLRPGGRLVTLDNVYVDKQHPLARMAIRMDRGQNVRWRDAYEQLFRGVFGRVQCTVYHDLLRIPYTHVIVEAAEPIARPASGAYERENFLAAGRV